MILKTKADVAQAQSLEQQLKFSLSIVFVVMFVLVLWIMSLLSLTILMQITILTVVFIPLCIVFWRFYQKIIIPFYSLTNLVEAVRLEDYSLRIKNPYQSGILQTLSYEISTLAEDLQQRKQSYDQHTLLIFHLIEQLETPIVIFNHQLQLTHANEAFSKYIEQPWQSIRLTLGKKLGFKYDQDWQFVDQNQNKVWQIKHSQFTQNEQTFHLVILTNVEALLRVNQQKSWLQIIRVLSHEIRNSLTPIKSLAQTLVSMEPEGSQANQALQVIVEQSTSLQEFVNRYSVISKNIEVNKAWFDSDKFVETVAALFPQQSIVVNNQLEQIYGDAVLLKQVLINLIKNAIEATTEIANENHQPNIALNLGSHQTQQGENVVIEVIDNGQGIANTENLFVPFYTTKKQGHGIGLGLCQNIIEQHGGRLTLTNNQDKNGAIAKIYFLQKHNEL